MPGTIKYKIFDSDIKTFDENDLTVEHFISTEKRDRGGDVMLADGMRINGKPVVLLQHGRTALGSEPIAKPIWIKKGEFRKKKGIIAKTKFFDDEQGLGHRLWQKTKEGYMPNWSIGYQINDYTQKRDYLEVKDWDLLEYSLVGVPMNPDAQTIYSKEYEDLETVYQEFESLGIDEDIKDDFPKIRFIIQPDEDEKEEKPYENEHSCHLISKKWDRVRRENDKFGKGIDAIWGIKNNTAELSSIRFDAGQHTESKARKWCKDHDYKCDPFEAATGGKKDNDIEDKDNQNPIIQKIVLESSDHEQIANLIIDKMKTEKLIIPSSGDPVPKEDKDDKKENDNPRTKTRLIIKQDEPIQDKHENAKVLAKIIAEAVGQGFKQGIRRLLGRVD